MRSKILVAVIGVLVIVIGVGWKLAINTSRDNALAADCNLATTWWNTRNSLSDKAFDVIHDESLSQYEAQSQGLTLVEGLVSWEENSTVPDFAQILVKAALISDQQWENLLRNALGQGAPTPTHQEMWDAMKREYDSFEQVKGQCHWTERGAPFNPYGGATSTAIAN